MEYEVGTQTQDQEEDTVRIVVLGDEQTGKSTLIKAAVHAGRSLKRTRGGNFKRPRGAKDECSYMLSDTPLDKSLTVYRAPAVVSDTSDVDDMERKLKQAHVVILTYSCDNLDSYKWLNTVWLPKLEEPQYEKVRVVIAGCKNDKFKKDDKEWQCMHDKGEMLIHTYPCLEAVLRCSAENRRQVEFALMARREPDKTFATLIDMGYLGPPESALVVITQGASF